MGYITRELQVFLKHVKGGQKFRFVGSKNPNKVYMCTSQNNLQYVDESTGNFYTHTNPNAQVLILVTVADKIWQGTLSGAPTMKEINLFRQALQEGKIHFNKN